MKGICHKCTTDKVCDITCDCLYSEILPNMEDDEPDDKFCENSEGNEIRSELFKMSFEELLKLKEKLGKKVYQEAMCGVKTNQREFRRENKNRPREVSSKVKPVNKEVKKKRITDPRFDRLCGKFDEKNFRKTYEFLNDIKKKEKEQLKKLLKMEKNSEEVKKIKYLIQRMENQEREAMKRLKRQEAQEKDKQEKIKSFKSGEKPHFRTKYEKKVVDLVDKYSNLKKNGKVEKFIRKKQKKLNLKERKKFSVDNMKYDDA